MSNYDSGNDSILEMYLFESETLLDQLDEILLQSEENADLTSEDINEIFRIMHTIKGSSAMMEFDVVTHAAHKLEDLFFIIREDGIEQENFGDLLDLVLKVSGFLKEEVDKIQFNQPLSERNVALENEIEALLKRLKGSVLIEKTDSQEEAGSAELEEEVFLSDDGTLYFLHARFAENSQMENIRAFMLVNKLESMGTVLESIPEELNNNPAAAGIILKDGFFCKFTSAYEKEDIEMAAQSVLSVESIRFVDAFPEIEVAAKKESSELPAENKAEIIAKTAANGQAKQNNNSQNLINVDLNKLDTLMDLIGEIVITESMVFGSVDLQGKEEEIFTKSSVQLRKLTDELQDIVMSIRMVPISGTFKKMHRVVRDIGKKLDKEVEFITMGESTEVDKTIIDGISDPLMHLVRNALDHGLESKEERKASGKDPVGKIILSAQNRGGDIVISVSDDGKGLDTQKIMEKAKEKKLLVKPEEDYSEKEILGFLMAPGFSTKEVVTEFSGRGVGMDVVKKNIEKVGGSVTIESEKGSGTNIFLKIPLTLSIISGMQVKVGENICEIPISNIRESFKITAKQLITDPDKNEMVLIRGICYPVIRLHEIFHADDVAFDIEDGIFMLVDSGDNLACLFMDELIMKHQIVVKPIPKYLNHQAIKASGIAGCTILGNGSISLIIDIPNILNQY
ncbi:MAG: chemotaxis protein CheW [Acetobacterium sp.]